jgi:hypothetical protein
LIINKASIKIKSCQIEEIHFEDKELNLNIQNSSIGRIAQIENMESSDLVDSHINLNLFFSRIDEIFIKNYKQQISITQENVDSEISISANKLNYFSKNNTNNLYLKYKTGRIVINGTVLEKGRVEIDGIISENTTCNLVNRYYINYYSNNKITCRLMKETFFDFNNTV